MKNERTKGSIGQKGQWH